MMVKVTGEPAGTEGGIAEMEMVVGSPTIVRVSVSDTVVPSPLSAVMVTG